MVLGASWSCIAPSPTRHNDHFEAILERNFVRPPNIVRKMARFNKLHCKVFFRSVSPCFLTKTIGVAGLLPLCTAVALAESRGFARRSFTRLISKKPAGVRCALCHHVPRFGRYRLVYQLKYRTDGRDRPSVTQEVCISTRRTHISIARTGAR